MLKWLNRQAILRRKAGILYGKVVAAARQPAFYGPGRVADTPEGRFGMVALHLFLIVERIKSEPPDGEALAQTLIETFVTDMDDCMREMGVGDLAVPKRVKRAAATLYNRAEIYRNALKAPAENQKPLERALTETLFEGSTPSENSVASIAVYVRHEQSALNKLPYTALANGAFDFSPPQVLTQ